MATHPKPSAKIETGEYAKFTDFMKRVVSVPRSEILRRMEEEKRSKSSSSPGPASDTTDH